MTCSLSVGTITEQYALDAAVFPVRELKLTLIDVALQPADVGGREGQLAVLIQQCCQFQVTTAAAMDVFRDTWG